MFRKTLSFVLTFALLLGIVIPNNAQKATEAELITEDAASVSSQVEVDGSIVKCTYEKDTSDYNLYLDDVKYDLTVDMYDGCAMVYLSDDINGDNNDGQVIAQSVAAIALSAGYWAPAIVAAAKVVIASVISATLAVATYYSAQLIATTINGVKSKAITKSDLRTKARTVTRALDVVQKAKRSNGNYYYSAFLYRGMVMLENQITFEQAVSRLKKGYDVFASNYGASWLAASAAGINKKAYPDDPHEVCMGDAFPHFHPVGRKWILNRKHQPHCWFPM